MKKGLFFLFFFIRISVSFSQNGMGYYYDYSNHFFVFDNGIERQLEGEPVTEIRTGNNYITYTDSKLSFIYYYNGEKQVLEENIPNKVVATSTAIVYRMQQRLMICEKGEKKLLSRNTDLFVANDSIIIWQALPSLDYMCYENGEIKTIITASNSSVINDYKVGNNIMVFNDLNYNLKIYFKGKIYDTDNTRISNYDCALNIAAFVDEYKNTFNAFYKGKLKVLSKEIIQSFFVSNNTVAFVDSKDNFFIFYDGILTKIDSRKPDFYFSKGNILYYSYNSELKIVYEGEIYTESLVEQNNIIAGENSLLFYSNINSPKYFYMGKVIDNFYVQKPYTMELKQDLPIFKYNNTIGILHNGKIQEFGIRAN